jgi:SAM-dependent methyltransferase
MTLTPRDWHYRFIQQARWTRDIRDFLFTRSKLELSSLVLDVGCGTGVLESNLSSERKFDLHALDINFEYLKLARLNAPDTFLTQGDGHYLPYSSKKFDIVFCHYLLLWVTDAYKVIQEMARITVNGGKVIAFAEPDYGGRIDYPPPLDELGKLQSKALNIQGADILIGRKLGEIFSKAGLVNIEIGVLGGQWPQPPSISETNTEWKVLHSDLDFLPEKDITHSTLDEFYRFDLYSWENRQRVLFVPTFFACGQVPMTD